jgi:hypothetical protein
MRSMVGDLLSIQQTLAAGAHGYLLKNTSKEELLAGLHTVLVGRRFLGSEIGLTLLKEAAGRAPVTLPARPVQALLSRREHELLQLVAKGQLPDRERPAPKLFSVPRSPHWHSCYFWSFHPVVLPQYFENGPLGELVHLIAIDTFQRFGGNHRVENGFFYCLNGRVK